MTKITTIVTRTAAVLVAAVVLGNATGAYAAGCVNNAPAPSLNKSTTNSQDWDQHKINVKGFACNAK